MKLLTTKQFVDALADRTGHKVTVRQIQREIRSGHIKAEIMGGTYLIKESALNQYEPRHPGVQGKK